MMIRSSKVLALTVLLSLVACVSAGTRSTDAASADQKQATQAQRPPANTIPTFEVDSTWPKDLPPNWTWRRPTEPQSDVLGINVDSRDHVWITHRGQIVEYDTDGKLLKVLPRPGEQGQYTTIHGMYLDHKGNMWTTAREEHQVLKLSLDGKVLLAIGENRVTAGSNDTLHMGRPAEVYVDAQTNELYVADGYTNHRVVVFDAETGKYLRHWGAYGKRPDDAARDRAVAGEFAKVTQFQVPHGITGSRDGLIYLADRTNSRIQVFRRNGEYVTEGFTRTGTGGAFSVALSPDPGQEFVYVTDGTQHRIWIFRRSSMEVVGQFSSEGRAPGQVGRPHNITTDSRGNIYVAEADPGRRAQKFVFKGYVPR